MSSTHYVYQCAPVRTPISRKIISIITLFCFCIMTLGQSFATPTHENSHINDWHPLIDMTDIAPQLGSRAFFQKLPGRDTRHLSETIDVDPQPGNRTSFQKIPRRDTISSAHPKSFHSAGHSSSLFRFLFGFLCLYTWLQKACAANLNLASLSIEGISITGGEAGDQAGYSVSSAGDVNGDGKADMLIGAPYGGSSYAGITYLLYGGSNLANINLANPLGTSGITITGAGAGYYTGWSVTSAGDVNGDGMADMLIGAPWSNSNTGIAYLIYGYKLSQSIRNQRHYHHRCRD